MSRESAKHLKQSLEKAQSDGQLRDAALALLRHSLRLGHRRLSLQRLEAAVDCGADPSREDLQRCAELALRVNDPQVHARLASLSRKLAAPTTAEAQARRAAGRRSNS